MIKPPETIDRDYIIYLPPVWRYVLFGLLALLGLVALSGGIYYLITGKSSDRVVSLISVAQTAIGAAVVILIVAFSEKNLSVTRLNQKTNDFLENILAESLRRIEIPQLSKNNTAAVNIIQRAESIHGKRKDIFGVNYELQLESFKMKMWVGINVKRIFVIYFILQPQDQHKDDFLKYCKEIFRFTFDGASKVGYSTNFEPAKINEENLISIWSTVTAEQVILGSPAEQLFWAQDIAMMTQSVARTAVRNDICLMTKADPGPL